MSWSPRPGRVFRWPRRTGAQVGREIDEELAHHIDLVTDEYVARGMPPDEARANALHRFGNVAAARRAMIRDDRRVEMGNRWKGLRRSVREDVVFALRTFRDRPGFTAVTIATLGIGIATATIFFGAVDSILLQQVALEAPEQVVQLWGTEPVAGVTRDGLAPKTIEDLAERSRSFAAVAAAQPHGFDLMGPSGPIAVNSWIVSEHYFEVLRTRPAAGRLIGPADFAAGAEPVVVISHAFWMAQYGGRTEAVGQTLALDGAPHTVLGVVPADFPVRSRDLFVPGDPTDDLWQSRFAAFFSAYGRLRPGASVESAREELEAVALHLSNDYPDANEGKGIAVESLRTSLVEGVAEGLWLLFAAAILILVIACVNVAGLMLAQAATRTRELAVRAAVGAGQGRLMRQVFTETALLAGASTALALPVAAAGLGVFRALSPPGMPRVEEMGLDLRVALFSSAVAFVVAVLVGLVPAVRVARPDLYEILKPGGRSGTLTPTSARLRSALVGSEVAIAVVLLIGGGLLMRSWSQLLDTEQGYAPDQITAVEVHFWQYQTSAAGRSEFARAVIERLISVPGVQKASVSTALPLAAQIGNEDGEISRQGAIVPLTARWLAVGPRFFETLGTDVVAGRPIRPEDGPGTAPVALINEEAARRLWSGQNPIGETIMVGADGPPRPAEVVGIVANVRHAGLEREPEPTVYVPHAQSADGSVYFSVRTDGADGIAILRAVLADLQPSLVVADEVSLAEVVAAARQPRRFSLLLLSAFALTAVLLTVVGLFGHLSHSIRSREHELGVRMALGAWPGRLVRMVLNQGLILVALGGLTGLVLAFGLSRFMSAVLYEVAPSDPLTFVVAALLVLAVGTGASYLPARRVSRVDPAVALRVE